MVSCYYCGKDADGSDDHLPPEVLYVGFNESYKEPTILTFPSCKLHNEGASENDLNAAMILAISSMSNFAADIILQITLTLSIKYRKNREFALSLVKNWGMQLREDKNIFDSEGGFTSSGFKKKTKEEIIKENQRQFLVIDNFARRISAGMHFNVTEGEFLGDQRIKNIIVQWTGFNRIDNNGGFHISNELDLITLKKEILGHGGKSIEKEIISGSRRVFQCSYNSLTSNKRKFVIRMLFYETIECLCWLK